jgi:hypothetical protein
MASRGSTTGKASRRFSLALFCLSVIFDPQSTCSGLFGAESPQPLAPFIQSIFPRGGRQGTELEITITGKYLGQASSVRVSGEGVAARILESSESVISAKVRIDSHAPLGQRDLRVFTPNGSFVQLFEVGSLTEYLEPEPNDDWQKAPPIEMPAVINGKIGPADYDHFLIGAQAGQVLVFDLKSSRNGARFDAVLSLLDKQGNEIDAQDDYYFDKDPHLVHRFSESGEYVLRVNGFREAGSDSAEYRLAAGELPSLSHVFPAGGRRGAAVELTLSGANLHKVGGVVLGHAIVRGEAVKSQSHEAKVRLLIPKDLKLGDYPLGVLVGGVEMPNSLIFNVSDVHEISARQARFEPPAQPLAIAAPVLINGIMDRAKGEDRFALDVRAGERYSFESQAMRLGNFLDPAILIYDDRGERVAFLDDTAPNCFGKEPPNVDFHLVHTFQKSGRYQIIFRDAGRRGHPSFVYRLRVRRAEPDFELTVLTNQLTVLQGLPGSLLVRVRRVDGWSTPVEVWIEGGLTGIESKKVVALPENTRFRGVFGEDFFLDGTNVELPLHASGKASLGTEALTIRGRGETNGKVVEHTAKVAYPWQKTGFVRGLCHDSEMLLTVAKPPLFDLESPPTIQLTAGKPAKLTLKIRWFADALALTVVPTKVPPGITIEALHVKAGAERVDVVVKVDEHVAQTSVPIVLKASVQSDTSVYSRTTPDIAIRLAKKTGEDVVASK